MIVETPSPELLAPMLLQQAKENIATAIALAEQQQVPFQITVKNAPVEGALLYDSRGVDITKGTGKQTNSYYGMIIEVQQTDAQQKPHLFKVKTDASEDAWLDVAVEVPKAQPELISLDESMPPVW